MKQHNKFILYLIVAVIITAVIFATQLEKARNIIVKPKVTPLISEGYMDIKIENDEPVLGNPGSALTFVLFTDFSSDLSKKLYNEIASLVNEQPQEARLFIKYLPKKSLFIKSDDLILSSAFCANKQSKYWQFLDFVNSTNNKIDQKELISVSEELKINEKNWLECINSAGTIASINKALLASQNIGIYESPTLFVNNKRINIDEDLNLKDLLSKLIAK